MPPTILPAPRPEPPLNGLAPFHTLDDFFAGAGTMRGKVERFFGQPDKAGPQHQVWNYWYVPNSYTYLRTAPEKILERPLVEQFMQRLSAFVWMRLGMSNVSWPWLSLYVEGCGQTIHNDSRNGAFGYVLSLTHWDKRKFTGGETQIFYEQDYWASGRFRDSGAGASFYELVASRFNQLLIFDDRLIHGVPQVRGVTDPLEGRLVLHGHMSTAGITATGPVGALFDKQGPGPLGEMLAATQAAIGREAGRYHGFATFAVDVSAQGTVAGVTPLVQRVLAREGPQREVALLTELSIKLPQLRFPTAAAPSRIAVPVIFS